MRSIALALLAALSTASAASAARLKAPKRPVPRQAAPEPAVLSLSTSAPRDVAGLVAHFQAIDRGLESLSASFSQALLMADAGMDQRVEGRLEYAKPSRLRVEHLKPTPQTLVSDGAKVWIHRVDQNQVIETSLADWKRSDPLINNLLDFGSYARMLETYDVSYDTASLQAALRPKDKSAPPFVLKLKLSGPFHFPAETELVVGGTRVRTSLSDLRLNPKIADERFRFKVPAGATLFENFKPPNRSQGTP